MRRNAIVILLILSTFSASAQLKTRHHGHTIKEEDTLCVKETVDKEMYNKNLRDALKSEGFELTDFGREYAEK